MKEKVTLIAHSPETALPSAHPLFSSRPQAGFPVATDDTIEEKLDLNQLVIKNPASTFFVRVEGDSMEGAGIFSGDILVIDRSREPRHGSIVVASVFDELTVKRLVIRSRGTFLVPEHEDYEEIEITEEMESVVWGVVTHALKSFV